MSALGPGRTLPIVSDRKPVAVLDTNVLLDIYSVHDVFGLYGGRLAGDAGSKFDLDAPDLVYRRARARESLLLAMHLHKAKAATFSLHSEPLAQLTRLVPDDSRAKPGTDYTSDFTRTFLWYVKDYLLPDWESQISAGPDGKRANGADQALVDVAASLGVPLITNEGFTAEGYGVGDIGKRAAEAGVAWYHPRGYLESQGVDESAEIRDFLGRFRSEAPRYLEDHRAKFGDDAAGELLGLVIGTYKHILLGETDGRGVVSVKISVATRRQDEHIL